MGCNIDKVNKRGHACAKNRRRGSGREGGCVIPSDHRTCRALLPLQMLIKGNRPPRYAQPHSVLWHALYLTVVCYNVASMLHDRQRRVAGPGSAAAAATNERPY
jgi:hypothetical protein